MNLLRGWSFMWFWYLMICFTGNVFVYHLAFHGIVSQLYIFWIPVVVAEIVFFRTWRNTETFWSLSARKCLILSLAMVMTHFIYVIPVWFAYKNHELWLKEAAFEIFLVALQYIIVFGLHFKLRPIGK